MRVGLRVLIYIRKPLSEYPERGLGGGGHDLRFEGTVAVELCPCKKLIVMVGNVSESETPALGCRIRVSDSETF